MTALARERRAKWCVCALWAAAPLYPSFIALMPIAPPGISLLSPPQSGSILLGVVLAIGVILRMLLLDGARPLLTQSPFFRAVWMYAASVFVIATVGLVPPVGYLYALFTVCTGIGTAAVLHFGERPGFARAMRTAMLWSSLLAAGVAVVLWILRTPAALYAVGNGRAIGGFVVPGELAGYVGMFLPFAIAVACATAHRSERMLAIASAVVQAAALVASLSRAGIVGCAVGLAILAAAYGRKFLFSYVFAVIVLAATAGTLFFHAHHNPAEDTNRLSIWLAALRSCTLFPLTGTGPGGFAQIYSLVRIPGGEPFAYHAHSLILATLAETGVIGTWALANLWYRFGVELRCAYRTATREGRLLTLGICAGFAGTWMQSSIDVVQILVLGIWIPFMGMALLSSRAKNAAALGLIVLAGCSGQSGGTSAATSPTPVTSGAVAAGSPSPAASVSPNASPAATPSAIPNVVVRAKRKGTAPVSIIATQNGRKLYTVDADSNTTERSTGGKYTSSFENPRVVFYNADGTTAKGHAQKADVDSASKVVMMTGKAHMIAADGTTLDSDRIAYDNRNGTVEGWSGVVITTTHGDTLRGEHITGDVNMKHVHIDGGQ